MNRLSVVSIGVVATVAVLAGCAGTDAPPGPGSPTLSLVGAQGLSAAVKRTVTEIRGGTETVVSVVDTTVWAPFDGSGTALSSSVGAGVPGPLGRLAASDEGAWNTEASFLDTAGILHEVWLSGNGRLLERMRYWRQGIRIVDYQGGWVGVTGGSVLDAEAMTFFPAGLPALRVDVTGRHMSIASATPFDQVLAAGTRAIDLLRPRPLAAQMYFGACSGEWLTWGGAALLAEIAWARFLRAKSHKNFKLAMAATGAAGVALDKLVDCMLAQPAQPTPGP
jgi:hypothetical protein